jgi:lipoate---protein ligase
LSAPPHGDSGFGALATNPLFDVEPFRALPKRHAEVRLVDHPTVVLGSTQSKDIVNAPRASAVNAEVVRRRGGGGAVLLHPDDHLWIEAWIPRDDPLWDADVAAAATWVGDWWKAALSSLGARGSQVHEGRAVPGEHGALVCFSGKGPGELFKEDRKVMGLSQWRGREGALFHTCAYTHWDPRPLVDLLEVDPALKQTLVRDLAEAAIGVEDIGLGSKGTIALLRDALVSTFATWEKTR